MSSNAAAKAPTANPAGDYAAVIALDWGDRRHAWAEARNVAECPRLGWLENTPEAIDEWARQIRQRYPGQLVAVVLEQRRGALVAKLSKYEYLILCPVNPVSLARYRKAFRPSGAKDDPSDALAEIDLFFRHPEQCPPLRPDTVETRTVQFLTEDRRRLVDERTRTVHRLRDQLKRYFPQIPLWFPEIDTPMVVDLLRRWPTLDALGRARPQTLRSFFRAHHVYDEALVEKRVAAIGTALSATCDEAVIQSGLLFVRHTLGLLDQLHRAIADYDARIRKVAEAHPDYAVAKSFPGAGDVLAPRLVAAAGTDRRRFATAVDLQNYSGISPVMERSGRQVWVHARYACPEFVRQTFHEWAEHSIPQCDWAKAFYESKLARGAKPQAAIRALAYKWMRIFFRCWQDRTPYCDAYYEQHLKERHARQAKAEARQSNVQIQWKKEGGFFKPTSILT